ncbi:hypothetical protein SNE40_007384 [Patella caerulea]|uniref:Anaphase-promoting complex subunit 4 n=1 Tax=Patella caerulea TaxID=87958 RepID=A0AAN8K4H5_PATCE
MPDEGFQQVDEKHVANEVEHMLWSPKIDLIALANVHGEVVLHRLSWQKVWSLQPSSEEDRVGGLAWRPDGKVLAVGYRSGKIQLVNTENASILHSTDLEGEITSLSWINQEFTAGKPWTPDPYMEDNSKDLLPKLQSLDKSYGSISKGNHEESVEDRKRLLDQKELNLLLVGTNKDQLHLFAYGIFPCGILTFSLLDGSKSRHIYCASISQDLHCLSIIVESTLDNSEDIDYYMLSYDTTLLLSRHKEIRLMALKYGQLATLIEYLQTTIQQMSEAWEDILMEMDSKLLKYAEEKKNTTGIGSVSNDFLELLLFGTPNWGLRTFLQHELTEKGLKKLGQSIENSYSNIQKLVVKHLQIVSQAIVHHLDEFRGMSLWYEKFGVLGLEVSSLQEAVKTAGSFVLKTSELQQVIDGSIKNFKAFLKWLYVVILRLSNEQPPAELTKMTQHDVSFVADFLKDNFSRYPQDGDRQNDEDKKQRFRLEKVGQYLKKEDLPLPPDTSSNLWKQFLNSNNFQNDSSLIYQVERKKSLVQLQDQLEEVTNKALTKPATMIGQSLQCSCTHHLFTLTRGDEKARLPIFKQYTDNEGGYLYTVFTIDLLPCDLFYILRHPTNSKRVSEEIEIVGISIGALSTECPDSSIDSNMATR